jgi:hypothetical protein
MTTCGICFDAEGIPSCSKCSFLSCVACTSRVRSCPQCREPFQKCRFCNDHRLALSPKVCNQCESTVCNSCSQCSESGCVSRADRPTRLRRLCTMCPSSVILHLGSARVPRRICACGWSVCRECALHFTRCPQCEEPISMTPYRRPNVPRTYAPRRARPSANTEDRQLAIAEHVARSLLFFFASPDNMQ